MYNIIINLLFKTVNENGLITVSFMGLYVNM